MIGLPAWWKKEYSVAVGFLVCAIVLCVIVGGWVAAYKDSRHAKIINDLKIERSKDIERGDKAEARATAAEADKVKLQVALEVAGKSADSAMEKVNVANEQFEKESELINTPVDACQRYYRLRAKLGLPPADCQ